MPIDYKDYPENWKELSAWIRHERPRIAVNGAVLKMASRTQSRAPALF